MEKSQFPNITLNHINFFLKEVLKFFYFIHIWQDDSQKVKKCKNFSAEFNQVAFAFLCCVSIFPVIVQKNVQDNEMLKIMYGLF